MTVRREGETEGGLPRGSWLDTPTPLVVACRLALVALCGAARMTGALITAIYEAGVIVTRDVLKPVAAHLARGERQLHSLVTAPGKNSSQTAQKRLDKVRIVEVD